MVASNLGADASSRQYDDVEGRLSLQEVPDKISRIFFGDPQKQYQQGRGFIKCQKVQKLRTISLIVTKTIIFQIFN